MGVLLAGCGGAVEAIADGAGNAAGADSGVEAEASGQILGQLLVTTEAFQGQLLETFTADLQPLPTPATTKSIDCPGATAVVGACCVFPPVRPVPSPVPGSGTGAGAGSYGTSAGTLTLLDTTTSTSIGAFGFGSRGYEGLPANYYAARWQPGDILSVSATGDQIAAFTVSAPALSPPGVQFPASFVATEGLKLTWEPDANAETMMIQILDSDAGSVEIACGAPDVDGTVAVDASLFAAFKAGDLCQLTADRRVVRYAQLPAGRVALASFGYGASSSAWVK